MAKVRKRPELTPLMKLMIACFMYINKSLIICLREDCPGFFPFSFNEQQSILKLTSRIKHFKQAKNIIFLSWKKKSKWNRSICLAECGTSFTFCRTKLCMLQFSQLIHKGLNCRLSLISSNWLSFRLTWSVSNWSHGQFEQYKKWICRLTLTRKNKSKKSVKSNGNKI